MQLCTQALARARSYDPKIVKERKWSRAVKRNQADRKARRELAFRKKYKEVREKSSYTEGGKIRKAVMPALAIHQMYQVDGSEPGGQRGKRSSTMSNVAIAARKKQRKEQDKLDPEAKKKLLAKRRKEARARCTF